MSRGRGSRYKPSVDVEYRKEMLKQGLDELWELLSTLSGKKLQKHRDGVLDALDRLLEAAGQDPT